MAMQFDLVSPERMLASFEATEVQIPGSEGDMTAMEDHMPVITTLRPGIVRAKGASGEEQFVVAGGFAEITAKSISVLAEVAAPRAEVTSDFIKSMHHAGDPNEQTPEELDQTYKQAADIEALRLELGL